MYFKVLFQTFLIIVVECGRQKRYIAFPEGSTFIATLCLSSNVLGRTENIFLEGVNWGISYDLPNITTVQDVFESNKFAYKRRQRRDLYNRIETLMERVGFEGKPCIYRAICESTRYLDKTNVIQKIIRLIFTYPLDSLSYAEPDEHRKYHWAQRYSLEHLQIECAQLFPECHLSIIAALLG